MELSQNYYRAWDELSKSMSAYELQRLLRTPSLRLAPTETIKNLNEIIQFLAQNAPELVSEDFCEKLFGSLDRAKFLLLLLQYTHAHCPRLLTHDFLKEAFYPDLSLQPLVFYAEQLSSGRADLNIKALMAARLRMQRAGEALIAIEKSFPQLRTERLDTLLVSDPIKCVRVIRQLFQAETLQHKNYLEKSYIFAMNFQGDLPSFIKALSLIVEQEPSLFQEQTYGLLQGKSFGVQFLAESFVLWAKNFPSLNTFERQYQLSQNCHPLPLVKALIQLQKLSGGTIDICQAFNVLTAQPHLIPVLEKVLLDRAQVARGEKTERFLVLQPPEKGQSPQNFHHQIAVSAEDWKTLINTLLLHTRESLFLEHIYALWITDPKLLTQENLNIIKEAKPQYRAMSLPLMVLQSVNTEIAQKYMPIILEHVKEQNPAPDSLGIILEALYRVDPTLITEANINRLLGLRKRSGPGLSHESLPHLSDALSQLKGYLKMNPAGFLERQPLTLITQQSFEALIRAGAFAPQVASGLLLLRNSPKIFDPAVLEALLQAPQYAKQLAALISELPYELSNAKHYQACALCGAHIPSLRKAVTLLKKKAPHLLEPQSFAVIHHHANTAAAVVQLLIGFGNNRSHSPLTLENFQLYAQKPQAVLLPRLISFVTQQSLELTEKLYHELVEKRQLPYVEQIAATGYKIHQGFLDTILYDSQKLQQFSELLSYLGIEAQPVQPVSSRDPLFFAAQKHSTPRVSSDIVEKFKQLGDRYAAKVISTLHEIHLEFGTISEKSFLEIFHAENIEAQAQQLSYALRRVTLEGQSFSRPKTVRFSETTLGPRKEMPDQQERVKKRRSRSGSFGDLS